MEQLTTSVYITNISASASEKTVSDFFSFCGKIDKLFLKKEENGTSSAVVQFETESAAKTALLLTNALIVDKPITVTPYSLNVDQPSTSTILEENLVPDNKVTQRDFPVPDEQRTKTSVIASLIAAGYVLGQDTLGKAKDYDEKHNISLQAKVAVDMMKNKVQELDNQYKISEKAAAISQQATDKAKKIDEQYHISEKAQQTATVVKTQVQTYAQKVSENPTVAKGITSAMGTFESIKTSASYMYNDYKTQLDKAIEEKQRERGITPPNQEEVVPNTTQPSDGVVTEEIKPDEIPDI